jgi:signal transduction histidine kinase/ActR/RegA family two-component response regulator
MLDFIRRSLRLKVVALVVGITFATLLLTSALLIVYDLRTARRGWVTDLITQADLVGTASAPALSFQDTVSAHQNLALLRVRPQIVGAAIFTMDGKRFATYARSGSLTVIPNGPGKDGARLEGDRLVLVRGVHDADERLGTIWITGRYDLAARLWRYLGILGAVMLIGLALAALLSSRLQSAVTRPVLAIAETANRVRDRKDFSLRVTKTTRDETGMLVDAFNELLERIGERTAALEAEMAVRKSAEDALFEANRRKDEFLATLAHELRNPLAPIRTAVHYLRMRSTGEPDVDKSLDIAERQVQHMVRLIEDLLDVSRITRDALELRVAPFALKDLMSDIVESSQHAIEDAAHAFAIDRPEDEIMLYADRARLNQAIGNVVNNAIKYTPNGGSIRIDVKREGEVLDVSVSDTGIGIPLDKLEDIFHPFSQLDRSLEKTRGGLGVGLALAQRLVALHGGSIVASSEGPGKGSTFRIRLPVVRDGAEPPKAEAASPPRSQAALRVLVADDNADAATSLSMLLRSMGHQVTTAHDGAEAFARAGEKPFALALLDIGMPKMNGYEVARCIRAEKWGASIYLVALTGWGLEEDRAEAKKAGFDDHVTKPVDLEALLRLFQRVAERGEQVRPAAGTIPS